MNFKESKPIYLQIADRLSDQILLNEFSEGARIPSVREYAAQLEVNVNTVARSYDYLQANGIIFNKRGIGYFVADGANNLILDIRRKNFEQDVLPDLFRQMDILKISIDDIASLYNKQTFNQ